MEVVLLEPCEEEGLVLAHGPAGGESENIVAEDRLGNAHQPVEIRNRVKALRVVTPQQSALEIVGSRLRHHVEYSPAGTPKLDAEVTGLNRHLFYGVGDSEYLFFAAQPDVVVFGSIQHVVVAARALAVDRKPSSVAYAACAAAPYAAAGSFGCAGQSSSQRERIKRGQG